MMGGLAGSGTIAVINFVTLYGVGASRVQLNTSALFTHTKIKPDFMLV